MWGLIWLKECHRNFVGFSSLGVCPMCTVWFIGLEAFRIHRNFSYRIALQCDLGENFHPLKPHVTIPLFFLWVKVSNWKKYPVGSKSRTWHSNPALSMLLDSSVLFFVRRNLKKTTKWIVKFLCFFPWKLRSKKKFLLSSFDQFLWTKAMNSATIGKFPIPMLLLHFSFKPNKTC
jgi:hypothetical protein